MSRVVHACICVYNVCSDTGGSWHESMLRLSANHCKLQDSTLRGLLGTAIQASVGGEAIIGPAEGMLPIVQDRNRDPGMVAFDATGFHACRPLRFQMRQPRLLVSDACTG